MDNLHSKGRHGAGYQAAIAMAGNQRLGPKPRDSRNLLAHEPPALRTKGQAFMPEGEDQRLSTRHFRVFGAFKLPARGGPDQPQIKPDQPSEQRLGCRMADQPLEH